MGLSRTPGGDPNANLYAQLKRDVLDRVPQITAVEYVPDDIAATQVRAIFDPARLAPPDHACKGIVNPEIHRSGGGRQ